MKVWGFGGGNRAWSKIYAPAKLEPGVRKQKVSEFGRIDWIVAAIRAVVASQKRSDADD